MLFNTIRTDQYFKKYDKNDVVDEELKNIALSYEEYN
jgi:hypothetical protein